MIHSGLWFGCVSKHYFNHYESNKSMVHIQHTTKQPFKKFFASKSQPLVTAVKSNVIWDWNSSNLFPRCV